MRLGRGPLETVAAGQARARVRLRRKRVRSRLVPPFVVALSTVAGTGAAVAWSAETTPGQSPAPTADASRSAAQDALRADARALGELARAVAGQSQQVSTLRREMAALAASAGSSGGPGAVRVGAGPSVLPVLPSLPSWSLPSLPPPVQATTGASGAPVR